jgi:general stress protein 26
MVKPHHDNEKTPAEVQDRIWELADKIDICMFTTWDGERQRSRPLSARPRRDEHAVHFLVDESGHKNEQVDKYPFVSMAWVDNGGHKYAVVSGKAKLSNDRATDPSIRLLTVTPEDGELWDSPNQAVALAKMAYAAVTGDAPDMGENAKVDL